MDDSMNLAYVYDHTFDGFLTAVFEAYDRREVPRVIVPEGQLQLAFGQQTREIETDTAKALRVEKGMTHKLGSLFYHKVWNVFLAGDPEKDTKLYRYIRQGFAMGRRVYNALPEDSVLAVDSLYKKVRNEAHRFNMFLRFSEMEGGVFYAKIAPQHQVLPLIMPHFADRYCVQPFIIHDETHNLAGIFDLNSWHLTETSGITLPDPAAGEIQYRRLWKHFYDAVAIKERTNPRCRMNFMPKRFWKNLTEINFMETPKTKAQEAAAPPAWEVDKNLPKQLDS
ncbi:TIGR03915 family putative DNA repair protein [Oscillospiraceae bacterium MB08-C2-2]|nr:TIGR03915 family putative DNA repair protein [Oscillospiraceae bacterium MB08-C2-2]